MSNLSNISTDISMKCNCEILGIAETDFGEFRNR